MTDNRSVFYGVPLRRSSPLNTTAIFDLAERQSEGRPAATWAEGSSFLLIGPSGPWAPTVRQFIIVFSLATSASSLCSGRD